MPGMLSQETPTAFVRCGFIDDADCQWVAEKETRVVEWASKKVALMSMLCELMSTNIDYYISEILPSLAWTLFLVIFLATNLGTS